MPPITREQFDSEQDSLSIKVINFLKENSDYAFTAKEVSKRISENKLDVEQTLNRLVSPDDVVERKRIDGEFYYAIKKTISRILNSLF
jgi:hypothetical protein